MNIYIIIAQRKGHYANQYALESVACMTEAEASENPEYLEGKLRDAKAGGEFESVATIRLSVNESDIRRILEPPLVSIPASVIP